MSLFAPGSVEIFVLTQYLNLFGIQVTDVYADQLLIKATGTVDAFNKAFSLEIHDFVRDGTRFHRPSQKPEIPFILRDILVTIIGPSDEARFRSRNVRLSDRIKSPLRQPAPLSPQTVAPGTPEQYTVGFVADHYDINPLYQARIGGRGQTIGIATLANGIHGYEPGAGIGVPDVTKLAIAVALEAQKFLTSPSTPGSGAAP